MRHRLYMVDVFAEQRYAGNPLAVIVGDEFLPAENMQQIAAEMNFSETTFVLSRPGADGGYRMRIFTPSREIEFTGHPLLGTAWVVRRHLVEGSSQHIQLNTPVGPVMVRFEGDGEGGEIVWFIAPQMILGAVAPPEAVATVLGLGMDDIDQRTPIQVVSAGTSAMMVPVNSLDALKRSRLDLDRYSELMAAGFPPLLYVHTRETVAAENDICVRFFFDAHGVREDPATGNGAAFFGAYMLEHEDVPTDGISLRIEQGYEVRRPSLIMLQAAIIDGSPVVRVGGHVVPTVSGELQ